MFSLVDGIMLQYNIRGKSVQTEIGVYDIGKGVYMDNRNHMGKDKEGVIFSIAPNLSEMGDSYLEFQ